MPDHLYRRGRTWWARIQVRGKDHRRSLRTSSLAEARKRLKKVLAEAEHFQFYGENRRTWKAALVEWAKDPGVKPSVVRRYLSSINQLRTILDPLYLDEINRSIISEVARRADITNATRRRDLTAVSAVLHWCVGHGWAEENPARTFDRSVIRERRDPIILPALTDIDRVVALAPGQLATMIRFAQYTGLREEEVASLKRAQVSEKRGAATVENSKTGRPRAIPLDDRAIGTWAGTVQRLRCEWAFHHDGERYANVASRFAELTKRAEKQAKEKGGSFRRFRFHDLRHWFAVDYLKRGGSIYDLQQILGHASIKTTEIYLDFLTPDEARRTKTGTAVGGSETR